MMPTEPLPLHHSWPLADAEQRFALGLLHDAADIGVGGTTTMGAWECALADQAIAWSDAVYDIFGLPRGVRVQRRETLALYSDESRAAMERLRAHAIKHRRGFTLDARIAPATGPGRWMRLMAMPVCDGGRVVRLRGVKQDVTALYRPRARRIERAG